MLKFTEADDKTKYMGLPNTLGRNKSVILGYLKNRLQDKIQGWDKKMLSKGGNEILLKTVAQSLPNYTMSMFYSLYNYVQNWRESCTNFGGKGPRKMAHVFTR